MKILLLLRSNHLFQIQYRPSCVWEMTKNIHMKSYVTLNMLERFERYELTSFTK